MQCILYSFRVLLNVLCVRLIVKCVLGHRSSPGQPFLFLFFFFTLSLSLFGNPLSNPKQYKWKKVLRKIKAATHWPIFCCRTAEFLSAQIGLKLVGTSACRTLADFLSRLTAFRFDFSFNLCHVAKDACSCDSHDNSSLVEVCASPDKLPWSTAHTSRQGPTRHFEI